MYLAGFDIGGTKCSVVLAKCDSSLSLDMDCIVDRITFATNAHRMVALILDDIAKALRDLLERNFIKSTDLARIGISCGGPLDSVHGIIKSPPNLPGWDDVNIKEYFESRFFVPVQLHNDANACALAELKFGAAKGYKNIIFLTFGTGMGAGIIIDGKIYSGMSDMAGEVGHIRLADDGPVGYGKAGSFEGFCSGGGIARLAADMLVPWLDDGNSTVLTSPENTPITAKAVAQAMYNGDEFARMVMTVCAEYLGRGLSILIDILNPEVIVIGSIFARNVDFFMPIITEVIEKEALSCCAQNVKILPAKLGDEIGDYAALGIVSE